MALDNDQKGRLSQAFKRLLNPDALRDFRSLIGVNPEEAITHIGLMKEDLEAFRAYFVPLVREPDDMQKERLTEAFRQLLEPEPLRQFLAVYKDKPLEALALVHLSQEDVTAFRSYLSNFDPQLPIGRDHLNWFAEP